MTRAKHFFQSENNIVIPPPKIIIDDRGIDPFFQKNKNTSQIKTRSQLFYIGRSFRFTCSLHINQMGFTLIDQNIVLKLRYHKNREITTYRKNNNGANRNSDKKDYLLMVTAIP